MVSFNHEINNTVAFINCVAGPRTDPSYIEEPDPELRAKEREGHAVVIRGLRKEAR
jgi:hypothetical protein